MSALRSSLLILAIVSGLSVRADNDQPLAIIAPDRLGTLMVTGSTYEDVVAVLGEPDNAQENQSTEVTTFKVLEYRQQGINIAIRQDLYKRIWRIQLSERFKPSAKEGLWIGMPMAEARSLLEAHFGPAFHYSSSDDFAKWYVSNAKGSYTVEINSSPWGHLDGVTLQGYPTLTKKEKRKNEKYFAGVSAQVSAQIAAAKAQLAAAEDAGPYKRPRYSPSLLAGSASWTHAFAAAYQPGVTTWNTFVRDGWDLRSPHNGDLGVLRLSGRLDATIHIDLGVVVGNPGFIANPPEKSLTFGFEQLALGLGYNFEAGYFDSEPIQLPSGTRHGGKSLAHLVCSLTFVNQLLTENDCTAQ